MDGQSHFSLLAAIAGPRRTGMGSRWALVVRAILSASIPSSVLTIIVPAALRYFSISSGSLPTTGDFLVGVPIAALEIVSRGFPGCPGAIELLGGVLPAVIAPYRANLCILYAVGAGVPIAINSPAVLPSSTANLIASPYITGLPKVYSLGYQYYNVMSTSLLLSYY